jgi:competence protein ComEC
MVACDGHIEAMIHSSLRARPSARPFPIVPPALAAAPFVPITASFAAGIAAALAFSPHGWLQIAALVVSACGMAGAFARKNRAAGWGWGMAVLCAAGIVRTSTATPTMSEDSAAHFIGRRVLLEGVVAAEPLDRAGTAVLRVQPTMLAAGGGTVTADDVVLLRIAGGGGQWRYGDVLQVEGMLEAPPRIDDFDYGMYLARQGVFAWMPRAENAQRIGRAPPSLFWDKLLTAKDAVRQSVRAVVAAPESALLNGILIGDDDAMPEPLVDAFRRTGTSHIISISGFNVGVIVGMVLALVRRIVHPRRAAPALLVVLWLYALFVGASASVVRAVTMTSAALIGQWLWRRGFTLNTLCAAAFAMLAAQPFYLVDVGFQLSFSATLGLVLVADVLTERIPAALMNTRLIGTIIEGVLLTTAAQITTLPLMLVHYEQISWITLLTNALVLPLQPPIMGLGMLGAGVGILSRDIGTIAALPAFALLRASVRIVEITAATSWASTALGRIGIGWGIAYYAGLCIFLYMRAQRTRKFPRDHSRKAAPAAPAVKTRAPTGRTAAFAAAVAVLAAAVVGMAVAWSRPPAEAQLWLRGPSALLLTPRGEQIVLLGDGDTTGLAMEKMAWWDYDVDLLIVPRLDPRMQEHALRFLRTYGAERVVIPRAGVTTDTLHQFWTQTPPAGVDHVEVGAHGRTLLHTDRLHVTTMQLGRDRLGNEVLGARIRSNRVNADLYSAGELTSEALHSAPDVRAALLHVAPSRANQGITRDLDVDWLIWSRAPNDSDAPQRPRRTIDLSDRMQIGFRLESERILSLP